MALSVSHTRTQPPPLSFLRGQSGWDPCATCCLLAETKLEILKVKTRTFVLKTVHEVLMPGIQKKSAIPLDSKRAGTIFPSAGLFGLSKMFDSDQVRLDSALLMSRPPGHAGDYGLVPANANC